MIAALLNALRALAVRIRRSRPETTPPAPALCAPGGERCADTRAPTQDEARGMVFAALLADPRAPWCVAIVEGRGPWAPLVRVTPGGPRPQVIATRWGDA